MLLFEIYDYEGKIIDTGVDKQTAAKILGVKPQDLFKETVVKGRKKKFKIGYKSYIVYKEGQIVTQSARLNHLPVDLYKQFDAARLNLIKSCTGATERR